MDALIEILETLLTIVVLATILIWAFRGSYRSLRKSGGCHMHTSKNCSCGLPNENVAQCELRESLIFSKEINKAASKHIHP
ncbi:MAG: hypothetical protein D6748_12785 [Calditrichaeota bacterium]|nr:MAG: hypothetical protein D6748_12785 [Calditrichota bacterium]